MKKRLPSQLPILITSFKNVATSVTLQTPVEVPSQEGDPLRISEEASKVEIVVENEDQSSVVKLDSNDSPHGRISSVTMRQH